MGGFTKRIAETTQQLGKMGFNAGGGVINWFPGHMAAATRVIRDRLKLADLVIEVRDARIPLSSANLDLQNSLSGKRRIIALNKKDLANQNMMQRWSRSFEASKQDAIAINAHSRGSVQELLTLVELKLREVIAKEPTLLVMVVGIPNVGKSALINSIHQIASSRFPVQDKMKRATVGPLPGVTQDIAGFKIAIKPSIYVLDTPGVLVPSIAGIETGLKLALTGAVKDSVVGEERIARYFLSVLNSRRTPAHWKVLDHEKTGCPSEAITRRSRSSKFSSKRIMQLDRSDVWYIEDIVKEVQRTLYTTFISFEGDLAEENELECLVDMQLTALKKSFKISTKGEEEARTMVSKKLIALFRTGKLGPFILDSVTDAVQPIS
ncbi:P-loop containing nucleoside triphosphate hydrolases superfamily protein [Wolffia australiana]